MIVETEGIVLKEIKTSAIKVVNIREDDSRYTYVYLMQDMKHPSELLMKVGFIGISYFTVQFLTMIYILIAPLSAATFYVSTYGQKLTWMYLAISIGIKLFYSLLGQVAHTLDYYLFPIDLICTVMWTLGLYFHFEAKMELKYFNYGILFQAFVFCMFF